jgi:hypothetical protein
MTLTMLDPVTTLKALPEFEATAQRMLTQWVKSKLIVQAVLQDELPTLAESEQIIDAVHAQWLIKTEQAY